MHFLRMFKKLRDRCEPGTYAYATQVHEVWLLRMHVSYRGDPLIDCANIHAVFNGANKIQWSRIADPTGDDMDCDWGLRFPREWKKSRGVFFTNNEMQQCYYCTHRYRALGYFCSCRNRYVSPYMSCKHFASYQQEPEQTNQEAKASK